MVNKRFYLGIQNKINKDKYVFFCDCDISLKGDLFKKIIDYFKNANLLIYKTLNGSHIVSLNFYSRKYIEPIYFHMRNILDCIDRDYYNWALINSFTTTLRISKKPNEKRELIYWQDGLPTNSIHKQYYQLFRAMLPKIPFVPNDVLEPSLTSFIGYVWDLDLSKKWTFEKVINGTNLRNDISQH